MAKKQRESKQTKDVDVVSQLECALRHPLAAALGAITGGVVPVLGRALAHGELGFAWNAGDRLLAAALVAVIAGCGLFSAISVYKFGLSAFGDGRKAVGFVAALDGVMLVSHGTASWVALALLVAINAVSNGCTIALARAATERRREADSRRSATRARNRAARWTTHRAATNGASAAGAPAETTAIARARARWVDADVG